MNQQFLFIIPALTGPPVTNTRRPQDDSEYCPPSLTQWSCQPGAVPATIPMVHGGKGNGKAEHSAQSYVAGRRWGWDSNQASPSSSAQTACEAFRNSTISGETTKTGQCKRKHVTDRDAFSVTKSKSRAANQRPSRVRGTRRGWKKG